MALTVATQIIIDGPRNTVSKTTGDALESDLPQTFTILDPALLQDMNPGMSGTHLATLLDIRHLDYSIADGMTMQLKWDATTPVIIAELYGRGKVDMRKYGGWHNNAGAGVTGKITCTLIQSGQPVTATEPLTFLLSLEVVKQRPTTVGGA